MRLLFISPYVPTSIRVRPYSLLKTLAERGHRLTLATLWTTEAERAQLATLEKMGIEVVARPLPRLRSLANCLGVLPTLPRTPPPLHPPQWGGKRGGERAPSTTPLQAVYCWQPRLQCALDDLLRLERFDLIHVEHLRGARYGLTLKDRGIPVVWDSVDCISQLFEQAAAHSRSLFGKWITRLELDRTRRYEGWLLDQFQAVLVTSEVDKQALVQLATSDKGQAENKIKVLPNGVDQAYFCPNRSPPLLPPSGGERGGGREGASPVGGIEGAQETLVFSGKMSYHANVTMALHLVHDIMPHIWVEHPEVKLIIVGQNPPPSVQKLGQDPRVTVTGYVPDIRPYIQQATVAVVPSVYGVGIQNKVLEAMACGTPVVATERAISALRLKPGQDILVANEPTAAARQVLRLLKEPILRETIGVNGRNYVKRHHDWSQIGASLEEIYYSVINN